MSLNLLSPFPPNRSSDINSLSSQHGFIQNTSHIQTITSSSALLSLLSQATSFRATKATKKNETSSRSHCIVTISVLNRLFPNVPPGKLVIVDLAGSERAADRDEHGKDRMEEAKAINTSLSCLKDCIRARAIA